MENIGALELYLFDFQSSPVMAELNTVKRNIMTDALSLYIDYLKWRESDGIDITANIAETDTDIQDTEPVPARSLQEVETEINIFRKWNRDVPEELLEEYQRLLSS